MQINLITSLSSSLDMSNNLSWLLHVQQLVEQFQFKMMYLNKLVSENKALTKKARPTWGSNPRPWD